MKNYENALSILVDECKRHLGDTLVSLVLFGSAAENAIRATSDTNVIFVLSEFSTQKLNPIRETLRALHSEILLHPMFILSSEMDIALRTLSTKFADIMERHRILFGQNPFIHLSITRKNLIQNLEGVLLNLMLRLRERYAMVSLREEQLPMIIADAASSLRVAAHILLELQSHKTPSPKESLIKFIEANGKDKWKQVIYSISIARETKRLAPGEALPVFLNLMEIASEIQRQLNILKKESEQNESL